MVSKTPVLRYLPNPQYPPLLILILLIGILGVSILYRIPVFGADLQTFLHDTVRWAGPALNFVRFGAEASNYLPINEYGMYNLEMDYIPYYLSWPFLPYWMLAGVYSILGDSNPILRFLPFVFNTIVAFYIYFQFRIYFNNQLVGLLSFALFLFLPANTFYSLQVCDTQFWLLGWIGSTFHYLAYRESTRRLHLGLAICWIIFACLSSWTGYFGLFALIFVDVGRRIQPIWHHHRWKSLLHCKVYGTLFSSPFFYVGLASIIFFLGHLLIIQATIGISFLTDVESKIFERTSDIPSDLAFLNALPYGITRILLVIIDGFVALGYHIPLVIGYPLFITLFGVAIYLFYKKRKTNNEEFTGIKVWITLYGVSFLTYLIVLPNHAFAHTFSVLLLIPLILAVFFYCIDYLWGRIQTSSFPTLLRGILITCCIVFVISVGIIYLSTNVIIPQARLHSNTYAMTLGKEAKEHSFAYDLILSNNKGGYYEHTVRFYLQRNFRLRIDRNLLVRYLADPIFQGVIYCYETDPHWQERGLDHKAVLSYLKTKGTFVAKASSRIYYRIR